VRRNQPGAVDYVGGISKCADRRVRTLLREAANVMLTRYKAQLNSGTGALAIAKRSTMRKARVALARRLAIIMRAMLRNCQTSTQKTQAPESADARKRLPPLTHYRTHNPQIAAGRVFRPKLR
jgi:hypothetical protein